jgi:hypothetical protein
LIGCERKHLVELEFVFICSSFCYYYYYYYYWGKAIKQHVDAFVNVWSGLQVREKHSTVINDFFSSIQACQLTGYSHDQLPNQTHREKKIVFAQDNGFLLINWYQTRKQQSHLMSLYLHTQVSVPAAKTNIRHKHHMYITHFCLVIFLHNYASLKRKFRASKQPAYMKHHAHSGNAMNWKVDASGTFKASFSMCQKSH